MSEKEAEAPLAETLTLLQKNAKSQSLFVWLTLPLALLLLIAALLCCFYLFQKVKPLIKLTPEYRLKVAYVNIKETHNALEEQFKPYDEMIAGDTIKKLTLKYQESEKFPLEAEEDLIALIEDYRAALFNLASNISGSGEWHRYQREQLRNCIDKGKERADRIKKMLAEKNYGQ